MTGRIWLMALAVGLAMLLSSWSLALVWPREVLPETEVQKAASRALFAFEGALIMAFWLTRKTVKKEANHE